MKKILLMLTVVAMAIFMVACGESASKDENKAEKQTAAEVESEAEEEFKYEISQTAFNHKKNSIGDENFSAVVEITNTGSKSIYLGSSTFDFEDKDGHLLQSEEMVSSTPDVVAPGEKGYYYCQGQIDDGVSTKNEINLVPQLDIKESTDDAEMLTTSDVSIKEDEYFGLKATGRVENPSDKELNMVSIGVVLFDKDGKLIDILTSVETEIKAGNKASFEASNIFNTDIKKSDVADFKVYASTTHYQW